MTSAIKRSVAKIIFWLHGHIHRDHNIHVLMYCTILSTVVAELLQSEVLCDVSLTADVRQTVNNSWFFLKRLLRNCWHHYLVLSHKDDISYFLFPQPFLSTFLALLLAFSHVQHKNNNRLFMAPHLIRAWSAYTDIRVLSFHHIHTHTNTHASVNFWSLRHTTTYTMPDLLDAARVWRQRCWRFRPCNTAACNKLLGVHLWRRTRGLNTGLKPPPLQKAQHTILLNLI